MDEVRLCKGEMFNVITGVGLTTFVAIRLMEGSLCFSIGRTGEFGNARISRKKTVNNPSAAILTNLFLFKVGAPWITLRIEEMLRTGSLAVANETAKNVSVFRRLLK